jgi:hypothetical protein
MMSSPRRRRPIQHPGSSSSAALFIIVPFLTWYFTWFGRALSDDKIAEYLADDQHPRNIQPRARQIELGWKRTMRDVKKFYPRIVELTKNSNTEVRKTVAWVMGQDNTFEEFHRALLSLLNDSEPLVRRNAALQLVRFNDAKDTRRLRPPELRACCNPSKPSHPSPDSRKYLARRQRSPRRLAPRPHPRFRQHPGVPRRG